MLHPHQELCAALITVDEGVHIVVTSAVRTRIRLLAEAPVGPKRTVLLREFPYAYSPRFGFSDPGFQPTQCSLRRMDQNSTGNTRRDTS